MALISAAGYMIIAGIYSYLPPLPISYSLCPQQGTSASCGSLPSEVTQLSFQKGLAISDVSAEFDFLSFLLFNYRI